MPLVARPVAPRVSRRRGGETPIGCPGHSGFRQEEREVDLPVQSRSGVWRPLGIAKAAHELVAEAMWFSGARPRASRPTWPVWPMMTESANVTPCACAGTWNGSPPSTLCATDTRRAHGCPTFHYVSTPNHIAALRRHIRRLMRQLRRQTPGCDHEQKCGARTEAPFLPWPQRLFMSSLLATPRPPPRPSHPAGQLSARVDSLTTGLPHAMILAGPGAHRLARRWWRAHRRSRVARRRTAQTATDYRRPSIAMGPHPTQPPAPSRARRCAPLPCPMHLAPPRPPNT